MSKAKISVDMLKEDKATLRKLKRKYDVAWDKYDHSINAGRVTRELLSNLKNNIESLELMIEADRLKCNNERAVHMAIWKDIVNLSAKIDANKKNK